MTGREVWVRTPFGVPSVPIAVAAARAGALPILDLGRDPGSSAVVAAVSARADGPLGVAVDHRVAPPDRLPATDAVDLVVVPCPDLLPAVHPAVRPWVERAGAVVAEVVSIEELRAVLDATATGVIEGRPLAAVVLRGAETGGRVGSTGAFVLLQQAVRELAVRQRTVPLVLQGGIGTATAPAALVGGAAGVVLDSQLGLTREARTPAPLAAALTAMDGSETAVVDGWRVFTRPDLPTIGPVGGTDLHTVLVPVGQDAALAADLAAHHVTVGGVVQAVQRALRDHPRRAAGHGRPARVLQGPMTRVSDRAAFAASVAGAGGLPFLALALLRGPEVRALLEDAADRLAGLPWGVGILGFVPPELRAEQLEVVHDVRPPCALIAGGRPSQAAPLEEAGITTYLHVPSPGLLDRFVRDGARRLVFEGRECGGHVGPRHSFALWDLQVQRLVRFAAAGGTDGKGSLAGLEIVFAGGVHDAASAAMVATIGAPLAERGAEVSVLMGTAYLFTAEAVDGGAIVPAFQDAAVACASTVLLETSPGHATRCVDSTYVRAFEAERRRLQDAGATTQEQWATLEQLNLGRLRIAAKGVVREGEALVEVDEATQQRDGMYMIGDVATLRHERTTVAELHREVTDGAADHLARWVADHDVVAVTPPAAPVDVAIVGMAGVFPGAPDLATFWSNIVGGVDAVTEVPAARWDADRYYDEHAFTERAGERTPSKWGGFLPDVPFDALAYGIPPRSLASIEPVQLLALEVARRALDDAGYAVRTFDRSRTSVIFGAEAGTDLSAAYGLRSMLPTFTGHDLDGAIDEFLPRLTEDSFPGLLANVIAGRIANRLDLGGVNYTVDAACAASLAALDLACKELVLGTSDMVLCGGADLHNGINDYLLFASVHALSPSGRCRTFDADADGIALGEGVACIVLKRRADAERDGDRIYAVIEGIAGSSDGRHLGLTAPRKEGQELALERAYARAGIDPATVGLVEAHGTGTVVGDRTELATLTEVFSAAGAPVGRATVGSVKSNIGHTKCAAGLAGVIKAAFALHHGVRPPTLHVRTPNPGYDPERSPFRIDAAAVPWVEDRRVAGVSAFGFGGTNFHAVLSAHRDDPEPEAGLLAWPAEVVLVRGQDRADAAARIDAVLDWLDRAHHDGATPALRDVAAAISLEGSGPVQVAVVADDLADLRTKLAVAGSFTPERGAVWVAGDEPEAVGGRLALLFPGQGSQRPGMLADLFVAFPWLRHHLVAGAEWLPLLYPPTAFDRDTAAAQRDAITDTRVAQPVLGMAGMAMAELLGALGVHPDAVAGHSYGELVALAVAGALPGADLLPLSRLRGEAILAAAGDDPGTMVAVAAPPAEVDAVLADAGVADVVVANRNAPNQAVISGPTPAIDRAVAAVGEAGMAAKRLPVACAFHSAVVGAARTALRQRLDALAVAPPEVEVWSNTTASPYEPSAEAVRATLARQVAEPVRWIEQIEAMYEAGVRVFVECGPGRVLGQLVDRILGDRPHTTIATDVSGEHGLRRLVHAVAELAVAGVDVDPTVLYRDRAVPVDLRTPVPAAPQWIVNGHLVRTRDGAVVPGGLRPMDEAPRLEGIGATALRTPERDGAVVEYLRGMRELVATQREVMLRYLGGPVPGAPVLDVREVATPVAAPTAAAAVPSAPVPPTEKEARAVLGPDELRTAVLAIVADRTGYPLDMLDPALDLEADLSIDSIKRIEILGELAERVGLPGADGDTIDEAVVEELAQIKTVDGIVAWIVDHQDGADHQERRDHQDGLDPDGPDPEQGESAPAASSAGVPDRTLRFVVELEPAPAPTLDPVDVLAGRRFEIVDDGTGIAVALAARLEGAHAAVRILPAPADGAEAGDHDDVPDGLIDLSAAAPTSRVTAREVFPRVRRAALGGARWLVAVTGTGGRLGEPDPAAERPADLRLPPGAGLAGLFKTLAQELPEARVRMVDVDPKADAASIADVVVAELLADGPVVVGIGPSGRVQHRPRPEPAPAATDRTLLPGPDGVVVLTGGARGITATVAVALAERTGSRIVLMGRSPWPDGDEGADTVDATDDVALRRALAARGGLAPAAIEAEVRRLLADREMRATMAALAAAGVDASYVATDVRDAVALRSALDGVHRRLGRIDLVIHGAGVLEDKLLRDKEPESFARVFDTKVCGAGTIVGAVGPDTTVVLFGSVAGVFGNRGQVDYAAANDALDAMARSATGATPRVLSVDWGPWDGGGMVSPELARAYERRGIGLVPPGEAVDLLLGELAAGAPAPQVVFMRSWS